MITEYGISPMHDAAVAGNSLADDISRSLGHGIPSGTTPRDSIDRVASDLADDAE